MKIQSVQFKTPVALGPGHDPVSSLDADEAQLDIEWQEGARRVLVGTLIVPIENVAAMTPAAVE